jgi:hypothetical protein
MPVPASKLQPRPRQSVITVFLSNGKAQRGQALSIAAIGVIKAVGLVSCVVLRGYLE